MLPAVVVVRRHDPVPMALSVSAPSGTRVPVQVAPLTSVIFTAPLGIGDVFGWVATAEKLTVYPWPGTEGLGEVEVMLRCGIR